jgi:hypothetical protein
MSKMSIQNLSKWKNGLELVNLKIHFSPSLENKLCKSKKAILICNVLVHDDDIFGKRGSNMTCWKKPHPIWPNGLRDMAF